MKEIDFIWTDAEVKKILHAATGNIKDFVMNEDGFISDFKASHTEVLKRDWEIIEFRDLIKDELFTFKPHPDMVDLYLTAPHYAIHSVRRLSDNVVFSVGDCVDYVHGNFTIDKFEIKTDYGMDCQIWVSGGIVTITSHPEHGEFKNIRKPLQRTPIFKTEDGKDIFEGDKWWSVWVGDGSYDITDGDTIRKYDPNFKGKRFSTEEKAKEYVILNKPFMSVQDVMNRIHAYISHPNDTFAFENLKQFAKQKFDKQ